MTGLFAQGLLRFATSWLVGRLAGRAALGVVQSAISTGTFLALLWPTVTGSAASKYLARARGADDPEELRAIAAHLSRRTLQSATLLAVASVPVWIVVAQGTLSSALWVALFVAAYSGYSFTRGVQFGTAQVARATTWDVISSVAGLLAVTVALLVGLRGTVLMLPLALSYGAYTLASWPRGNRGSLSAEVRRDIDHFVVLGVAGTIASSGFLQLSMVVAKLSTGDEAAGQYAAAMATATPASMLALSLSLVLFPAMAEAWGRGDVTGFRAQTDRAMRGLLLMSVTVFGSLIVGSRSVMAIWGHKFDPTVAVFPVLLLAIMSTSLAVASVNALTTRSKRGVTIATGANLVGLAIGSVMWLVLAPEYGILGVALGYLAGTVTIATIPIAVVWRTDEHHWRGPALRLVAGLGVLGVIVATQRQLGLSTWTDPLFVAAFCLLWWTMSWRDLRLAPLPSAVRRRLPGSTERPR
jgi:putative peptidoglycan lipid II flippase